ncbi:MAG: methylenetetrahydrofolate reductase [Gaiellales bacterium]|nr:methylenetetrahydrofolate reductase [Gaiellales bacterium]MDX6598668.1 methylenetetrahydrofolate reductase [Gaiellales bacterium]
MSKLEQKLAGDGLVITGELPVVDGGGLEAVREKLEQYEPWVDALNATDNTAAHAHASNVSVAIALLNLGMEPIMQVVCRDKNRLAIQADIVGAALHGVENISCLTGDDVTAGDEPEARRVFDLDGPQAIVTAAAIARGEYLSGRKIQPAPHLFIGAVENAGAPPLEYRAARALKKARAGARFLQLQIGYEPAHLEAFCAEWARMGIFRRTALLPSICLVGGARSLEYMDSVVPGISVPPAVIERVKNAADPREEAFELAVEQGRHALAQPGVRGLHLIAFRKDDVVGRLCERLGIPSTKERDASGHGSTVAV